MRRIFAGFMGLGLLFCVPGASLGTGWPNQDILVDQAEGFLILLDQGDQQLAWLEGTPLFMALHPVEQWQAHQQAVRTAYGAMLSRELKLVGQRTSYTQSPDGHYVIVQFSVSFANKEQTVETVVLDCQSSTICGVREYILR